MLRDTETSKCPFTAFRLHPETDLLIRPAGLMRTDLNGYFPIQPPQEFQQLIGGKPVEMPIEQVRHLGLLDRK